MTAQHEDWGRVSRRLSYVLRHDPASIGVRMDPAGWVDISDLLSRWTGPGQLTDQVLRHIAETDPKRRYTIRRHGHRDQIRAAQGHSLDVDLGLRPVDPPAELWHGTTWRSLPAIKAQGLLPGQRQMVHLSTDAQAARTVGARHGRAVVLRVDASAASAAGTPFYRADNGVWLSPAIAPAFLHISHDPTS